MIVIFLTFLILTSTGAWAAPGATVGTPSSTQIKPSWTPSTWCLVSGPDCPAWIDTSRLHYVPDCSVPREIVNNLVPSWFTEMKIKSYESQKKSYEITSWESRVISQAMAWPTLRRYEGVSYQFARS